MAENEGAAAPQAPQVKMNVLGQFIRDISFENILAQKGVTGEVQPDIKVQVALDAKKRPTEHQFDISMKLNITSKAKEGDDVFFVLELDYVGIFHVEGIPQDQLHPFLMIECPRQLFPFVRRIVSDITRDGGFPPLNMDQIDFVALYRQQLAAAQAAAGEKKLDA
ncbi:protein-export chaperone SecB [Cognatishimia sp.]|uniref:protein-export chaperone SecB n=1 Tax=Cognatishimia sp. TaxID=2211648 RepID=UPI0035143A72